MPKFDPAIGPAGDEVVANDSVGDIDEPFRGLLAVDWPGLPKATPRSQATMRFRSITICRERTQMKMAARPPPLCPLMFRNELSLMVQYE